MAKGEKGIGWQFVIVVKKLNCWSSEFDKMKQKSEGIGLVVGRVQRIEEEAANASLKVTMIMFMRMMFMMIMRIFDMTKMVMKLVMMIDDEITGTSSWGANSFSNPLQIILSIFCSNGQYLHEARQTSIIEYRNVQLDRSTHHSASQDVLEVKTMLLRLTRILQQVRQYKGSTILFQQC